jgi:outer membrane lipoprotein-sorting protein
MNDLDEQNLMEILSPLSAIAPHADDAQHILQSARLIVHRRSIARIAAIAAIILLAVFFGITSSPRQDASAAEALAQATQATGGYKGWITWTQNNTQDSRQAGRVDYEITFNTETGTSLSKENLGDHLEIRMFIPDEKKQIVYDSRDGQIKITALNDFYAELQKKNMLVLGQSAGISTTTAPAPASSIPGINIVQSTDAGLLRLDITYPPDNSLKPSPENRNTYPQRMTVWADPSTKLIQRRQMTAVDGKTTESTYRYGESAMHDIYDAGVPKNAKVIDLRPTQPATDLLAKLQKQFEAGFGGYVAVRAEEYAQSQNGKPTFHDTRAYLYANDSNPFLVEQFRLNIPVEVDDSGNTVRRTSPPPPGWPTPTLDATLSTLIAQKPSMFMVSQGNDLWAGDTAYDSMNQAKRPGHRFKDRGLANLKMNYTLPGLFWAIAINLPSADIQPQLISQNDRPGLLGLKYEFTQDYQGPQGPGTEKLLYVYWFDPTKDLVPVEFNLQTTAPANWKEVQRQVHTDYSMFVRTDNGKWYPSAWTTTESYPAQNLKIVSGNHLQLWPSKKLPADWFTDLSAR